MAVPGRRLRVIVEADGGSRGNPGPSGYGAVVREAATGEVLLERSEAIGVATNNVAEYGGLIAGLQAAAELGAVEVEVRMDSKLVVEQMAGRWQIKNQGLRPLAAKAAELVRRFGTVSFTWIPRERNKAADALANQAMDQAAGRSRPPKARRAGDAQPGQPTDADSLPAVPPVPAVPAVPPASRTAAPAGGSAGSWAPRTAEPLRLLLIRHGETALTTERRYSGRGDVPLNDRGLAQARAVAARVNALGTPLTAVVTSPLERCVRTAEFLAGAPIALEPDLVECDFGSWEGLTFADVRERWPDQLAGWLASTEVAPPAGESFGQVAERVRRAADRLRASYPTGLVAVVSHVSPIKLLLRDALDAGDGFLHRCYLDPAGLSIVDFWSDGGVAVRTVNDTAHLS